MQRRESGTTRASMSHTIGFFERPQDLCDALFRRFDLVRPHPQEIEGLLHPFFFDIDVELFMRTYIAFGLADHLRRRPLQGQPKSPA
jgi:hypothetical protein